MKEIYAKPKITATEDIQGAYPVVGFLVAYAAGRAVKKAMEAHPISSLTSLQKVE